MLKNFIQLLIILGIVLSKARTQVSECTQFWLKNLDLKYLKKRWERESSNIVQFQSLGT